MKITLTLPPGINKTYGVNRNAKHPLYKKEEVKAWEVEAGYQVKQAVGMPEFKGYMAVGITWYYKHNRDIDAGLKVLLDLLQKQRVYLDDRQVRKIKYIDIYEDKANPRVELKISRLPNYNKRNG